MLFSEAKPGMIVRTPSKQLYLVAKESVTGGYNSYKLDTCELHTVYGHVVVEHIGYIAIETVPKAPEFVSVARP